MGDMKKLLYNDKFMMICIEIYQFANKLTFILTMFSLSKSSFAIKKKL